MLPLALKSALEANLEDTVISVKYVGGGSINETACIQTKKDRYFVKWNIASKYPGMFEAETKGLHILHECSGFIVPDVISSGVTDNFSFLLMEFIERSVPHWSDAGKILANMHRYERWKDDRFGLDHDNYIGSLKQSNTFQNSWSEFYAHERILPQVKLAMDGGRLTAKDLQSAEQFCKRVGDIFPNEKPSLLHGDLWSGNFMFTENGPSIFDPAVYWGHREMDIAMTRLFGGFDEDFYEGYNEDYPLEKNWELRIDFCNLYPLLVHVNLFGGGYVNDVRRILKRFA